MSNRIISVARVPAAGSHWIPNPNPFPLNYTQLSIDFLLVLYSHFVETIEGEKKNNVLRPSGDGTAGRLVRRIKISTYSRAGSKIVC